MQARRQCGGAGVAERDLSCMGEINHVDSWETGLLERWLCWMRCSYR